MVTEKHIKLPDDAANTGKKQRTRERLVGSDLVHDTVIVSVYPEDILGLYYGDSSVISLLQTAHATNTGFGWFINSVGSGVKIAVRRLKVLIFPTTLTGRTTTPILRLERMTFTGTSTGTPLSLAKRNTTDATAQGKMIVDSTGITITAGNPIRSYIAPLMPTLSSVVNNPVEYVWEPLGNEGELILNEGEGITIRQHTNGDSGEDRAFIFNFTWLEY